MIPVSYGVRNLLVRRATSVATVVGVALVVFVLAASLMLTEGIRQAVDRTSRTDNAIVIRKGNDAEVTSVIEQTQIGLVMSAPGVEIGPSGTPVAVAELVIVSFMQKANSELRSNVTIRGIPENALEFRPELKIVQGRAPRPGTDEVMAGSRIHGRFKGVELGQSFELRNGRMATVVGVFEANGSSFESEIWGDVDSLRAAFGHPAIVSSIRVRLQSEDDFDRFEAAVEQDKRLGLDVMRETAFYERQSEGVSTFFGAMGTLIAFFFAIGAMTGATITMHGAVANRRRDIGILRAIGFSRTSVLTSFLIESLVLTTVGGVIGATASISMSLVEISILNPTTVAELVFTFTPTVEIIVTAVVAGGFMGVLGGFIPAVRAARTSIISAVRE